MSTWTAARAAVPALSAKPLSDSEIASMKSDLIDHVATGTAIIVDDKNKMHDDLPWPLHLVPKEWIEMHIYQRAREET